MKSHERPNVIVFFTDQQRWDTTGVHGNPLDLTPNFDRMAKQGTHLYHSFTCQPVCGPARATLQTGMYGTTTGSYANGIPLPQHCRTLAHYFQEAGYRTGYIGKWHLASKEPVPEDERGGYEYWLGANVLEHTSDAYDTLVYNNDNEPVSLPGYRADALTDAAIRYVDEHKTEPFFLFLSHIEPHQQNHLDSYPAPAGYEDRYSGRWMPADLAALGGSAHAHLGGYYGMVKRLDEALGRLFDSLQSLKLVDRTIVLFTSDHGCHFKTRKGGNVYKSTCHESSIRTPAALTGPKFERGGEVRELISLIDIPPTLLDAAGIEIPAEMQGRSILPLLKGEDCDWPEEVFIQITGKRISRALRMSRWKYSVIAVDSESEAGGGSSKYVEDCLYDLLADPHELNNVIGHGSMRNVADDLQGRLIRRMVEAGEQEPVIESVATKAGSGRRISIEEVRANPGKQE
jgi:arylsulfatase A-like enzyme